MSIITKKPQQCPNCKNYLLESEGNTNALTCTECGLIVQENSMVGELNYQESSNGSTSVTGTMVSHDQARPNTGGKQNALGSKEQTIANARRSIKELALSLNIPDYTAETAVGWFKLALNQNFVQGRKSQNVIATCLYIASRRDDKRLMLIDFSSKLQISVYSLGSTFLKMVKHLNIVQLPLGDPSFFITHLCEQLGFDEEMENGKQKVINDANELAKRMAADFIHYGRRPAGIAGACVLLAARMNGFRRTHNEIVAVAHIAEDTLQKRLEDFRNTNSGDLSIKKFREIGKSLPSENPPSFYKGQLKEKKLKQKYKERIEKIDMLKKIAKTDSTSDEVRDNEVDENENENGNEGNENEGNEIEEDEDNEENEDNIETEKPENENDKITGEESEKQVEDTANDQGIDNDDDEKKIISPKTQRRSKRLAGLSSVKTKPIPTNENDRPRKQKEVISKLKSSKPKPKSESTKDRMMKSENLLLRSILKDCDFTVEELESYVKRLEERSQAGISNKIYETPSTSAILDDKIDENKPRNLVKFLPSTEDILNKVSSDATLDDINLDSDVEEYFNDEETIKLKETAWLTHNADFLREQERKRLKMETDVLTGNTSGSNSRKRKRNSNKNSNIDVIAEAGLDPKTGLPMSIEESVKKISRKINYAKLDNLDFS